MKYDFETTPNRKGTGSMKWDQMYGWNPEVDEGVIPLSVADMELKNAPEIYEGLIDYLKTEPVLGYVGATDAYYQAVIDWQKRRHNWQIEQDWIVTTPGVIAAFYAAVRAFSKKDDGVIIFRPVYYPFGSAIEDNRRTEVNVPLIEEDGDGKIDFEGFEEAASKPENKILIFCSPHNPVGRVWTEDELKRIADIANKHDIFVVSDEIWYDLLSPGVEHTVIAKVDEELQKRLIVCTAASKSFSLAGMHTSNIIIPNEAVREKFVTELERSRQNMVGIMGFEATRLAYEKAEDWLDQVNDLVYQNQLMVKKFFEDNYPKITAPISEGTYLQWLDFRALGMSNEELEEFLHKDAQFFTDEGYIFGEEGSGCERTNVACPRKDLQELLDRLLVALKEREEA